MASMDTSSPDSVDAPADIINGTGDQKKQPAKMNGVTHPENGSILNEKKENDISSQKGDKDSQFSTTSSSVTSQLSAKKGTSNSAPTMTEKDNAEPSDVDAKGFNFGGYRSHLLPRQKVASNDDLSFTTITEKDSPDYDLSEGLKLVIVFNQENFIKKDLTKRNGTEQDCEAIKTVFEKIGFRVDIYDDRSIEGISRVLRNLQSTDEDMACLFVFILTHGEENGILHAHDMPFRLDRDIVGQLTPDFCPSLAGKPKIIFVQACQGKATDDGFSVRTRSRHTSTDGPGSMFKIPHYADFLIFQASYYGHYSFRSKSGSWLIQSFCKVLKESEYSESFHDVIIRSKRIVALYKESNVISDLDLHMKKQIPLVQDTLIRRLYLKRIEPMEPNISMEQLSSSKLNVPSAAVNNSDSQQEMKSNNMNNNKTTGSPTKKEKCKVM